MSIYKTPSVIYTGENGSSCIDIASIIDNAHRYTHNTLKHGVFNTFESVNTSAMIVYKSSNAPFRVYCLIYQQDVHVEDIVDGFKTFSEVIKSIPMLPTSLYHD